VKIFVAGDKRRVTEFRNKLNHEITHDDSLIHNKQSLDSFDVIVDFNADERNDVSVYFSLTQNKILILSAVKKSLANLVHESGKKVECAVVGINALPTFIDRNQMEISFLKKENRSRFETFAKEMKFDFLEVQDRVGMVTPRVICMIINEACFTLQEGTASMEDIDKGMKLGTNYPFGPFEWCDRIGIKDVYETLDAVWNDTHDPRYKICPLLKTKYLKTESFYQRF